MGLLASPAMPGLLILLSLGWLCGQSSASYASTAPKDVEIYFDAKDVDGSAKGEKYPVVTDGAVRPNWEASGATLPATQATDGGGVVLENVESSHFLMRSGAAGKRFRFSRPSVAVGNRSIISPHISGSFKQGGELNAKSQDLVVRYNCLQPGFSSIMIRIPFAKADKELIKDEDEEASESTAGRRLQQGSQVESVFKKLSKKPKGAFTQTAFLWGVTCPSAPRQGFTVQVVGDPVTSQKEYKTAANVAEHGQAIGIWLADAAHEEDPTHMYEVGHAENATRFIVSMQPGSGPQTFLQPQISALPKGIANPVVVGALHLGGTANEVDGDEAEAGQPQMEVKLFGQTIKVGGKGFYGTVDVRYNCHGVGVATVELAMNFPNDNYAPVIIAWRKVCGGGEEEGVFVRTATGEAVVTKGHADHQWDPLGPTHHVETHEIQTKFKLSKEGGHSSGGIKFGEPHISAVPEGIMTPQLEGNARKGGQILGGRGLDLARDRLTKIADSHKEAFSVFDHLLGNELSVKYNCIKTGSATLNMIIPLAMHDDLHFSWTKECGGQYRQYLSVSTWEKAVVRDGIPYDDWSAEYTGEPFAAVADSSEDTTSFFVTLDAVDGSNTGLNHEGWSDWLDSAETPSVPVDMAIQTYQRPSVQTSDKRICNPSLGGIASKGGTVTSYGGQQQMDVKYNCLKQGSATITVTVPMQAYEAVTFSWTKVCRKEQVQGWMIGTAPSEDDVVSDGQPWIYFDSHPSAEGKRMIVDRETPQSTFFVWLKEGAEDVDFHEPIVTASPAAVCSPRTAGEMRKGGSLSGGAPMTLVVRYNCVMGGSTVITVRIPPVDETKDAVVFSWRKTNGPPQAVEDAIEKKMHGAEHGNATLGYAIVGLALAIIAFAAKLMCSKDESSEKTRDLAFRTVKTSND